MEWQWEVNLNIGAGRVVYQGRRAHRPRDRDRRVRGEPGPRRGHRDERAQRRDAARDGPRLARRRPQPRAPHRGDGRPRRAGAAVVVHAFLDGRDTPPRARSDSLAIMDARARRHPGAHRPGRPLLRDGPRPAVGPRRQAGVPVDGRQGMAFTADREAGLEAAYRRGGESDSSCRPTAIDDDGHHARDGDVVVFMNFRDRPREMTGALTDPSFTGFERGRAVIEARGLHVLRRRLPRTAGRLPRRRPSATASAVPFRQGTHPLRIAGDREVRARHLLLQRRRGAVWHPGEDASRPSPRSGRDQKPR